MIARADSLRTLTHEAFMSLSNSIRDLRQNHALGVSETSSYGALQVATMIPSHHVQPLLEEAWQPVKQASILVVARGEAPELHELIA